MNNLPLFDDFLLYIKSQNYSDESLYSYERDLTVFDIFLTDSSIPFDKIDKRSIGVWIFGNHHQSGSIFI